MRGLIVVIETEGTLGFAKKKKRIGRPVSQNTAQVLIPLQSKYLHLNDLHIDRGYSHVGVIKTLCLLMLSWIFTDEFWLRAGPKAVMTQCRRRPVVLMRFFTDERCEQRCKVLLFFYQFSPAYLMSEVISKTAVKQYVPLDTNHYLQVVLQARWLLSSRFFE